MKNLKELVKNETVIKNFTGLIYISSIPLTLNQGLKPIGLGILLGISLGIAGYVHKRDNSPFTFFPIDTEDYEEEKEREVAEISSSQLNAGCDYFG
jgi:hypothetical protein